MNDPESEIHNSKSKLVLLVDDDATARYGMRRALEDTYKVLEAESPAVARRVIADENPDLLLLDIEMPEENGLDFLRALKESGDSRPVIMITAYGSERVAVEASMPSAGSIFS